MSDYNEDHYEQTLIELFTERLGYEYLRGSEAQEAFTEKDYYVPVYRERLQTLHAPSSSLDVRRTEDYSVFQK